MSNNLIDDGIEIRVVQEEDRQRISEFLVKYFYPYEPLNMGSESKEVLQCGELILSNIQYGTCLMAVIKETGQLVGLTMTGPKDPNEAEHFFKIAAKEGNTKRGKMIKFLACLDRDTNVFKRYNVQKVLHVMATCVDTEMRGRNIGARLYNAVSAMGKEMGFELLTSDCTSFYSARIKDHLGWECFNVIYYKDYLDENNQQVFRPEPPHDCCKSYAIRL